MLDYLQVPNKSPATFKNDMKIYYSIVKYSWMYQFTAFLTSTVTLIVFPGVTALVQPIQKGGWAKILLCIGYNILATSFLKLAYNFLLFPGSTKTGWEETYFTPVCCFVLFNFGDYLGTAVATRLKWPKPNNTGQAILLGMSTVRIIFIPLFMYCNAAPTNRYTTVCNLLVLLCL